MAVQQWREHFPALQSGFGFFDNAGGSQTLSLVADRVRDYLLTTNVQHGASYEVSVQARDRVAGALNRLRQMFNAKHLHEIWMGPSSTQLLANLAQACRPLLQAGDEIILTNSEHHANSGPWLRLAESVGVSVKFWCVDPATARLNMDELHSLITPRTKIIAMCQVSNILGAINPVADACKLARTRGIFTCIDGVAYGAHQAVDVQALDCDAYVVSMYKIFGPHIGCLIVREQWHAQLASVNHSHIANENVPYRFQPGGVCYELAYGAGAVVDYLETVARDLTTATDLRARINAAFAAFDAHEQMLSARLLAFLSACKRVRIIGPASTQARVGTFSFTVAGATPESICLAVDAHQIGIRHGHFHTVKLMQDWDLLAAGGVVRISLAHYNTEAEVDKLIGALTPVLD